MIYPVLAAFLPAMPAALVEPKRQSKQYVRLSEAQWIAARFEFESSSLSAQQSVNLLCTRYDVTERTVWRRVMEQKWKKGAQIASSAADKLQSIVEAKLEPLGQQIAERIGKRYEDQVAEFIAREKPKYVRNAFKRIRRRQGMIDNLAENIEELTAKDAAYIAKSDDTYDNMARRTLGMNDSAGFSGNLNVQILAGQAAVQLSQS